MQFRTQVGEGLVSLAEGCDSRDGGVGLIRRRGGGSVERVEVGEGGEVWG